MKKLLILGLFFLLSNLLFAGRYYDAAVGRFLQIDPHASKYPSISPYSYAANNPLTIIDPDGRDIILIHNKEGASDYGHSAVLIGNDNDGWSLYSKNGEKFGVAGADNYESGVPFNTLSDFANDETQSKYEVGVQFSTDSDTDAKAKTVATEQVKTEYDISGGNCADLTSDVAQSVNINIQKPQKTVTKGIGPIKISKTFTDPKAQIEQSKKIEGAQVINLDQLRKEKKNDE